MIRTFGKGRKGVVWGAPSVRLMASSVSFGATTADTAVAAAQTIEIRNGKHGTAALATPTASAVVYGAGATGWLAAPSFAPSATYSDGFTCTIQPSTIGSNLSAGTYTATFTVDVAGATGSGQTVTVTIVVTASAVTGILQLDRTADDARGTIGGSNPSSISVGVRNMGAGSLGTVSVLGSLAYSGTSADWCSVSFAGGTMTVAFDTSAITVDGLSECTITVQASGAQNTVEYKAWLLMGTATSRPMMSVSPSTLSPTANEGSNAGDQTITVTNVGTGSLGTLTATKLGGATWLSTASISTGFTVSYTSSALGIGTYSETIRISSSDPTIAPYDVAVVLRVTAVPTPGAYPAPRLWTPLAGYTWHTASGQHTGSIFNSVYPEAQNFALPAFAGTTHYLNSMADWTGTDGVQARLRDGRIADGDRIVIPAGSAAGLIDLMMPVRAGWARGTGGFVQIVTANAASLPTYRADRWEEQDRIDVLDQGNLAVLKTQTTNRSVVRFEWGSAGYWFTGIDFYADCANSTQAVVATNGCNPSTGSLGHSRLVDVPEGIVFDRCNFDSRSGHLSTIALNSMYSAVLHCTLADAYRKGGESKSFSVTNNPGPLAVKGCKMRSWGMTGMLVGGADFFLDGTDYVTTGVDFSWNYCDIDETHKNEDYNCKNFFELKHGIDVICAFNVSDGLIYKGDQQHAFNIKANDQDQGSYDANGNPTNPDRAHAARVNNVLLWGNRFLRCGKGFISIVDSSVPMGRKTIGGALGVDYVEVAHNIHFFDYTMYSPLELPNGFANINPNGFVISHGGDTGSTDLDIHHNLYMGRNTALEAPSKLGSTSRRIRIEDNIKPETARYGAIRTSQLGVNSTALNNTFGAGNWTFPRNFLIYAGATGTAGWDSTLRTTWGCGYVTSADFVDLAAKNCRIAGGSAIKGISPGGVDPGPDWDYVEALATGVTA